MVRLRASNDSAPSRSGSVVQTYTCIGHRSGCPHTSSPWCRAPIRSRERDLPSSMIGSPSTPQAQSLRSPTRTRDSSVNSTAAHWPLGSYDVSHMRTIFASPGRRDAPGSVGCDDHRISARLSWTTAGSRPPHSTGQCRVTGELLGPQPDLGLESANDRRHGTPEGAVHRGRVAGWRVEPGDKRIDA